jgi:transposase InsO family protein
MAGFDDCTDAWPAMTMSGTDTAIGLGNGDMLRFTDARRACAVFECLCSKNFHAVIANGEVIRLAFIIDAFDREIIASTAVANARFRRPRHDAGGGREAVRSDPSPTLSSISDNGSAYTARETRLFAEALNLTPWFTPVASPQSNGMSEAFVKTLKRDYIRIRHYRTPKQRFGSSTDGSVTTTNPSPFRAQDGFPSAVHQG